MKPIINNPLFRPPAEAYSLIIQVQEGCPYNRCFFCGMYNTVKYSIRPKEDIHQLIQQLANQHPNTQRIFLADGDVIFLNFPELVDILTQLKSCFPKLARVNMYANGSSILKKSRSDLQQLKQLKVHTLYMGLESGDDKTLVAMNKKETSAEMIKACCLAQSAELRISVMILLGLGSIKRTKEHAKNTASAINIMQPRLLSALRVVPIPGTFLYKAVSDGSFRQLTEYEIIQELHAIISDLKLKNTIFRANHTSNVVPFEGRFPKDKERLLMELNSLLQSGNLNTGEPGPMPIWL